MEKAAMKEAILKRLSDEIDVWLDKQQTITPGYEYEGEFIKVTQKLN